MAFRKIIDSVPAFYESYLPQVFQTLIPPEPFSDCLNCPMIAESRDTMEDNLSKPFAPDTKCCTFNPRIPNYMAGAILSDTDPAMEEGRRRIAARIEAGEGIFPNGVYPTPRYHQLYLEKSREEFGKSRELLCPYFQQGRYNCTVWKYREAICAIWFCKHLAGTGGREFWNAVTDYMKFMQESLINVSAYMCGLEPVDPYGEGGRPAYSEPAEPAEAAAKYLELWKDWAGHETEYYIKCHEIVTGLEDEYILKIQEKGAPLAHKIESIANEIIKVPDYMMLNKKLVDDGGDGYYRVEIRNYIEILQKWIIWSFRLPRDILDLFDGTRKTTLVVQQILESRRIRIEPEILIALYRHGVLTVKKLDIE
jgi:hypothetical protein